MDARIITHVVVAAARHLGTASAVATLEQWRTTVLGNGLLPTRRSLVLFVDNGSPALAAHALRAGCERIAATTAIDVRYARNDDWSHGFGFELGAWRWALRHELPRLARPLAADALIYLTQDSLRLARPALPYPPPRTFTAAPLLSFASDGGAIQGVTADDAASQWRRWAPAALKRVAHATPYRPATPYTSSFGPSLLVTWAAAEVLRERGLFDMIKVRTKLDEQLSERLLGWLVTNDLQQPCSVGGDYYLNFLMPKALGRLEPADRAFSKEFHNRTRRR